MTDAKRWEEFARAHVPVSGRFLYSFPLLRGVCDDLSFRSSTTGGAKEEAISHLEWLDHDRLVGIGVSQKIKTPIGSYLFFARGPILATGVSLKDVLDALPQDVMFVRFEPVEFPAWAKETLDVSPRETLVLDLTKSEDELLAAMHPKTRYNIRVAERKGVVLRPVEDFDAAWNLFTETARRDKFRLHPREHYEAMLRTQGRILLGAYLGDTLLAAGIFADSMGGRTYLHGASSSEHRDVMAPYLLHWRAILEAKRAGLHAYDFWGISNTNPAWAGITRFKRGFGGKEISCPGTFDYYKSYRSYWSYRTYTLLRAVNRFLR